MIFLANISVDDLPYLSNNHIVELSEYIQSKEKTLLMLSGAIEMEISSMHPKEQKEFLQGYGLDESGLSKGALYHHYPSKKELLWKLQESSSACPK